MATAARAPILGLVLAGGRSRRMEGGDKAFAALGGRPLLAHALRRLGPQVDGLAISANGPDGRYAAPGWPVIADTIPGYAGPLAGVLAGMRWARSAWPARSRIATAAVDTPFFPADLVARLAAAAGAEGAAVARSGGRVHPVFALVPVRLADDLAGFLAAPGTHRASDWLAAVRAVPVDFAGTGAADPFANINTGEDLAAAEARIAAP